MQRSGASLGRGSFGQFGRMGVIENWNLLIRYLKKTDLSDFAGRPTGDP
jgi:hypothetical protein